MKWTAFALDVNLFVGLVDSPQVWAEKVVQPYLRQNGDIRSPLTAQQGPDTEDGMPFFAHFGYCDGPTLEEWAKEQEMELPVQ